MEVRVLEYFLAVAREQSISGAADVLHLTQPTLSRQLKELEDELGKQLMIRGSRRITLTEDGMLLRKRAEEIVSLVRRTRDEVMNNTEEASGDVYIGAGETRCMSIFADVMTDIRRECPGIRFHTVSGDSADIMERLDKGLFDFCLIMGNVDISRYNSLRIPARDEFGLLMRRDSSLASREYITSADLDGIPLMFSRQVLIRDDFADWLGKPTADLDIVGSYNLTYNASIMAKSGLSYIVTLDGLINTAESELVFRPFRPAFTIGMSVIWKKYQVFSRPAELFLERLRVSVENHGAQS